MTIQTRKFLSDATSRAVALFRRNPELDDVDMFKLLVTEGMTRRLAGDLVVFIPMAYAHVLLTRTGAQLPQSFQRRLRNGGISDPQPFSADPVWNESLAFAQREVAAGLSQKDLLQMAGRSAEFEAANQLLNQGSKLQDIRFTSALLWPEEGPEY